MELYIQTNGRFMLNGKWFRLFNILIFILIFHLNNIGQSKPPFERMDVFDLEWVTDPQISPDGQMIVYVRNAMDIVNDGKTRRLWMINSDGSNHRKLTSLDVNEGNPVWSPDGKKIAFTASTEAGNEIFVFWVSSGQAARITSLENSPSGLSWSSDGKYLAFSMFVDGTELSLVKPPQKPKGAKWADPPRITTRLKHEADGMGYMKPGFSQIFVLPSDGGSVRQLTHDDYNHRAPLVWSKDDIEIFFSGNRKSDWEYDFRNSEIYSVSLVDYTIRALTDRDGPDHSHALSPDGNTIAYLGYNDKKQTFQNTLLYTMKKDGSTKKYIPTGKDISISNPVWDSKGEGLFYMFDETGETKVGYSDVNGNSKTIVGKLGGISIGRPYGGGSFSVSSNGDVAFTYSTPYHPSELALIRNGQNEIIKLTSLNDHLLSHRELGQVEEIWYTSTFDNRKLHGWIVKPPNFDRNVQYPLIVELHGGPTANYSGTFTPEIQLYASAGYVVFYPNPRGSTSYGEEFGNLLYHNYPGEDYNDVMDGVDVVIQKGYIDENQLFVTGGSAGGIMAAWMIGKNNRFRAAAVIKPVMNWISKTLVADNYYGYADTQLPGQPWENFETYWKFSPISLVGDINTPTLVMVGMEDYRTPPSEAKQLYHALKLRKVETVLVEVPGAPHFIANRPSQLITKVDHIIAWFDRYRKKDD